MVVGDDAHFGVGGNVILPGFTAVQLGVLHHVGHIQLGNQHPAGNVVIPGGDVDPVGGVKCISAFDADLLPLLQLGQHLGGLAVGAVKLGRGLCGGDIFFQVRFFRGADHDSLNDSGQDSVHPRGSGVAFLDG